MAQSGTRWATASPGTVDDLERSAEMARSAWELAKEAIGSGRYQLVVLDEVTYPINWGWVDGDDVATSHMPPGRPKVNIFLTGRDAPAGPRRAWPIPSPTCAT